MLNQNLAYPCRIGGTLLDIWLSEVLRTLMRSRFSRETHVTIQNVKFPSHPLHTQTATTTTTISATNDNKHNDDTIEDAYVVMSTLFQRRRHSTLTTNISTLTVTINRHQRQPLTKTVDNQRRTSVCSHDTRTTCQTTITTTRTIATTTTKK